MSNRKLTVLVLSIGIMLAGVSTPNVMAATPQSYYIDCNEGSDSNAGTSRAQAWQTLSMGSQAALQAGDELLLKRGCVWQGSLMLSSSGTEDAPIHIGAYGEGDAPTIESNESDVHPVVIDGNYHLIEDLAVVGIAPARDENCDNTAVGLIDGFLFSEGASYNVLRNSSARGLSSGIRLSSNANNNYIVGNVISDNNMMSILSPTSVNNNDDTGAFGIEVIGDYNEIAYNTISGGDACSYDYWRDGSAIEIYGGHYNSIHHNLGINNNTFTELGRAGTSDNTYAYNVVTSPLYIANFLVTRGPNDTFGPVLRTRAYNNTIYLTGSRSLGVNCASSCNSDILTLKNNIIWSEHITVYTDFAIDEGNNLVWRSDGQPEAYLGSAGIDASSVAANPAFVDIANGDFRLQATSPAVDMGITESIDSGFGFDFDGLPLPIGSAVDVGAYEYAPPEMVRSRQVVSRLCTWTSGAWYLWDNPRTGSPDDIPDVGAGYGLDGC